jgi:hypothetical protein
MAILTRADLHDRIWQQLDPEVKAAIHADPATLEITQESASVATDDGLLAGFSFIQGTIGAIELDVWASDPHPLTGMGEIKARVSLLEFPDRLRSLVDSVRQERAERREQGGEYE